MPAITVKPPETILCDSFSLTKEVQEWDHQEVTCFNLVPTKGKYSWFFYHKAGSKEWQLVCKDGRRKTSMHGFHYFDTLKQLCDSRKTFAGLYEIIMSLGFTE
jgi:hypothetical protein